MPRLYILSGVDLGRTLDLGDGDVIGRDATCSVRLRATSISRRHARLERCEGGWAIVDEGSRNGLFHEGARIARLELLDGAVFLLGDVELRFREGEGAPAPPAVPPPVAPSFGPEEIELEEITLDEGPAAPPAAPPPAPTPPPAVAPPPPAPAPPPAAAPPPAPARSGARERMAEELARSGAVRPAAGGLDLQGGGRPPLQYHTQPARGGLFVSDLSQLPGWMRTLLVIGAIGLALGAFLVAFRATGALKGGAAPPADTQVEGGG